MKYKELVDKLQPFSEEEINITACTSKLIFCALSEVRFYDNSKEGNLIVGVKQFYNPDNCENITLAQIILPSENKQNDTE